MLKRFFRSEKFRYLMVGGWNTIFGYATGVYLYTRLEGNLSFPVIGILANILNITMSFLTYKTLVFRTRGCWLQEYLKCYIVYGFTAVLGIAVMWILVRLLEVPIWLAQAMVIGLTVTASYVGHSRLTFKVRKHPLEKTQRGTIRSHQKKNQHRLALLQRRRQRR